MENSPVRSAFAETQARSTVDYMLRTVQQHHVQLSLMVDQKANIMIGATLVLLTLLLGHMARDGVALWSAILSPFALAAAVCALLATMPTVKPIKLSSAQFNPLFFGHFTTLTQDEYLRYMERLIADDGQVYHAMTKNIYQIGRILHDKKYRYLGWSYRLFLVGIVLAAVSFIAPRLQAFFG